MRMVTHSGCNSVPMLLTVKIRLLLNSEQKQQLLATMENFNAACDMVSEDAFACRCFNKFAIQAKLYKRIREEYGLSAQLAVRCISKAVVSLAKDTGRGIALEELTHINVRSTVRKSHRDSRSKWAFSQLRRFIEYKAALAGVVVKSIDPRNTSRQCSACGHIDMKNRPTQSDFCCISCGHSENADLNAAKNIRNRAAIIQPIVVRPAGKPHEVGTASALIQRCVDERWVIDLPPASRGSWIFEANSD